MSLLKGIGVTLRTATDEPSDPAGTDDHLYIGLIGTSGGREFPLDAEDHEDFETGSMRKYSLGKTINFVDPNTSFPRESEEGGVNDPGFMPIIMEQVFFVYLRKQDSEGEDDAYRVRNLDVVLYGDQENTRTYHLNLRGQGPWLSTVNGQVVYLTLVPDPPGIGAA